MTRRARGIPRTWERFPPRPATSTEPARPGGWITPCPYGGRHLAGEAWRWWVCPTCSAVTRRESRDRLTAKHQARMRLYYPGEAS